MGDNKLAVNPTTGKLDVITKPGVHVPMEGMLDTSRGPNLLCANSTIINTGSSIVVAYNDGKTNAEHGIVTGDVIELTDLDPSKRDDYDGNYAVGNVFPENFSFTIKNYPSTGIENVSGAGGLKIASLRKVVNDFTQDIDVNNFAPSHAISGGTGWMDWIVIHTTLVIGDRFKLTNHGSNRFHPIGGTNYKGATGTITAVIPSIISIGKFRIEFTTDDPTYASSASALNGSLPHSKYVKPDTRITGPLKTQISPACMDDYDDSTLITKGIADDIALAAVTVHEDRVDNPHVVTKTQVGLSDVTNDKQVPLAGTVQGVAGKGPFAVPGIYPDYIEVSTYAPTYSTEISANFLAHTFVIGEIVEISGSTWFNGFWEVLSLDGGDFLTLIWDESNASPDYPGYSSFYTYTYNGSGEVGAVASESITGPIDFDSPAKDMAGFNTLSAVNAGYVDRPVVQITNADSPYAASWGEDIEADSTAGNITIDFPTAVGENGKTIVVTRVDASANTITADGNAAETINGSATDSIVGQWESNIYKSNDTNITKR